MIGFLTAVFTLYLIFVVSISLSTAYQTFLITTATLSLIGIVGYQILRISETDLRLQFTQSTNIFTYSKKNWLMPFLYFAIILLCSIIYWLGNFPGGFNLDAYGQWLQAHGLMQYNDWHPFVSTLLIQLILQVNDSFVFYIAVQIIAFSAAVSYLLSCIQKQGVDCRILLGISLFIGLNPAIGLNTVCMTKDVQFTILITLFAGTFIRIISTDGKWLNKYVHLTGISILSIALLLIRHNGVLFIVPAFLSLLVFKVPRIKVISSGLIVFLVVVLVKWPVADALNVDKHDNILGETVGIPMGMMANALIKDEDNIPQEVHAFLNMIAEDEQWKENYITGEWDSCKWKFGGTELFKNNTFGEILEYTATSIQRCPQACYESFRESTKITWSLFDMSTSWIPYVYVEENTFHIDYSPMSPFHEISTFLMMISQLPVISFFFWNTGFFVAGMLILWLMMKIQDRKNYLVLVFPLFLYAIGTMLLLSGPSQRYFYCDLVLVPPLLFSMVFTCGKEKLRT